MPYATPLLARQREHRQKPGSRRHAACWLRPWRLVDEHVKTIAARRRRAPRQGGSESRLLLKFH
jgi:hypothetical protein